MPPTVEVIEARDVPLGGLRAMTVRRTLPARGRSFVGAWCFVDHFGPNRVDEGGPGMDVAPHPHTGLQTVTWLFEGEVEHRDTGGHHAVVRPGEVNLMTAGHGIAHSEVSTPDTTVLHGVQLWVALPESDRDTVRGFEHYAPEPVPLPAGAGTLRVFLGNLGGLADSPVQTRTPLIGAELNLAPGARVSIPVKPSFEHAFLLDRGDLVVAGIPVPTHALAVVAPGVVVIRLEAGVDGARVVILGGLPFEEEIVMWWNFVGRSHEEIVAFREEWEAGSERFGTVEGYVGEVSRIPAPALPGVRLKPRGRRGRRD